VPGYSPGVSPDSPRPALGGARRLFTGAALLLLYAIPAAVYLHPILLSWGGRILGDGADPILNLYVLKWGAHQLRLGLPDLWDANFFYPARGVLAFSDHLIGPALQLLLLLDLHLVPNAVAGYNLLLTSSFVLSGATTCWVLRQSGRSWTAAILGGGMYAFAPMRWAQFGHIQILLTQWLPLTLWLWHRLLAEPTWKRAALFFPFYLLHLTGGCYLAYMIHIPMLALLASRGAAERSRLLSWRGLRVLLAVAVPALAAVYLLFSPYVEAAHRYRMARSPDEAVLYSASLLSYLAPSEHNLYAGWWHRIVDRWKPDLSDDESRLFAGFVATALAAYGLLVFLRRHHARPARPLAAWRRVTLWALLAGGGLAFLWGDLRTLDPDSPAGAWSLSAWGFGAGCGLWLLARRRWGGNWPLRGAEMDTWERGLALGGLLCFLLSFPIVFVPLMGIVPGLAGLRAPGRFYVVTSLVIVHFAARGLDALLPVARGRRLAVAAALAAVLAVELAPDFLPSQALAAEASFPAVYRYLRDERQVRAVLELPLLRPSRESRYMYYSTLHWKPLANGYSGYTPDSYEELRGTIPVLPDGPGFHLLRRQGISHLVVHLAGLAGRKVREQLPAWESAALNREVTRVFAAGTDVVYELIEPGPAPPGPQPPGPAPSGPQPPV
jgi:hypothetical protein